MLGKDIRVSQQTVDDAVWHWLALPSSLIIIYCDFIGINTPKNWRCSCAFLLLLVAQVDWWSLLDSSGSKCDC